MKKALALLGFLVLATGPLSPEIFYPWTGTYIGALDAAGWPGLVFAPTGDSAFAFVLRVEREGEAAEGADLYYLVSEVGAHSPDGLYARMRFDLGLPLKLGRATPILMKPSPRRMALTIEWSRRDERTVIGRIVCPEGRPGHPGPLLSLGPQRRFRRPSRRPGPGPFARPGEPGLSHLDEPRGTRWLRPGRKPGPRLPARR